jgi:hypothetical protein
MKVQYYLNRYLKLKTREQRKILFNVAMNNLSKKDADLFYKEATKIDSNR